MKGRDGFTTVRRALAALSLVSAFLVTSATAEASSGLKPGAITATKEQNGGLQARIELTVSNRGDVGQRGGRKARLRMIGTDGEKLRLGNVEVPKLGPGKSIQLSHTHAIPGAAGPGDYDVEACVRSHKRVRCATASAAFVIDGAKLVADPISQSFGTVTTGAQQEHTFTITNTGDLPSGAIDPASVAGAAADQFAVAADGCGGSTLAPGASCTVGASFVPTSSGAKSARLEATATPGGTAATELSGTGSLPAHLVMTPATYDFGPVLRNTNSPYKAFTVENTGDEPSSAIATSLGGSTPTLFEINGATNTCAGQVLAPAATCSLEVRFNPNFRGARAATVNATATTGGTASSTLSGFAANPSATFVSPGSHDFGAVPVNSQTPQTDFTVTNTGDLPIGNLVISVTSSTTVWIPDRGTCGNTLAPGANCTFRMSFKPINTGAQSASVLVFDSTTSGTTSTVSLTGSGMPTP